MVTNELLTADSLRAFAVFSEHLNFTRAAEVLHLTQPSLHTKIGKLSNSLEIPLYRRVGRRLELTVEGERLAAYAHDAIRRADEYLHGDNATNRVTLAAGRATLMWVVDRALRRVVRGGTTLRVLPCDRHEALHSIAVGEADVAAIAYDPPPSEYESHEIGSYPQQLIVPRGHSIADASHVGLADVAVLPLIVPPPGRPHRTALERALGPHANRLNVVCEADGWDLIVHLVGLGVGASIVNGCVRTPASVTAIPLDELPPVTYWLTWRTSRDAQAARLIDALDRDHAN